ncbi:hypothetical protein CDAR_543741 [Caerostris darwini]|uniref:Uncharacterized protein n=1 Tax=Caerostris darwini TaxID=1538125 RepID=A0AAV4NNA3_9ARAC|nr:hypothetical protein CDAR_543741 [Caerostris darwini]
MEFLQQPPFTPPPKEKKGWGQEQEHGIKNKFLTCKSDLIEKEVRIKIFVVPPHLSTLLDSSAPGCRSDRLRSSALAVCQFEFQCLATCI